MKVQIKAIPEGAHVWFAWYPVVARKKVATGFVRYVVWLQTVSRKHVSGMGLSQWLYEVL